MAINETLFYFTEDHTMVPRGPEKDILIFLRSCDLHAVRRLDEIYLKNGFEDFCYARVRERAKFVLIGCENTCPSGFCVSMGTNRSENYDAYIKGAEDAVSTTLMVGFKSPKDVLFKADFEFWKEKITVIKTVDTAPEGYEGLCVLERYSF